MGESDHVRLAIDFLAVIALLLEQPAKLPCDLRL
jgi:hypothetical protein